MLMYFGYTGAKLVEDTDAFWNIGGKRPWFLQIFIRIFGVFRSQVVLAPIKICVVHVHLFESFGDFGIAPVRTEAWPFEDCENVSKVIVDAFKILPEFAE